jgi:hypothetical protein
VEWLKMKALSSRPNTTIKGKANNGARKNMEHTSVYT